MKYFYYLIISLLLVFVQQSVLSAFGVVDNFNLLLVVLVFITVIFGFNLGFMFAVFVGFLANFYSFLPLGTLIFIYLLIIWLVDSMYRNVLINFSLFSILILTFIATCLYQVFIVLFVFLFNLIGVSDILISIDKILLFNLLWQILFNLIFMVCIYVLAKITIKRLNLSFLIKK